MDRSRDGRKVYNVTVNAPGKLKVKNGKYTILMSIKKNAEEENNVQPPEKKAKVDGGSSSSSSHVKKEEVSQKWIIISD